MGEKATKVFLISFNVICLMAGVAMFTCGILLEFTNLGRSVLTILAPRVLTTSQLGAIGVVLIALGAFIILVSFMGCCGAVYESRGMLAVYFVILLILLLGQVTLAVLAFVFGFQTFSATIERQLTIWARTYRTDNAGAATLDTIQQFFQCCGSNGPNDFTLNNIPSANETEVFSQDSTIAPSVTTQNLVNGTAPTITHFEGEWPKSCCKREGVVYVNESMCLDRSLSTSTLEMYLNVKGCTTQIEAWIRNNLIIIGGVAAGIALLELIAMIVGCTLRKSLG